MPGGTRTLLVLQDGSHLAAVLERSLAGAGVRLTVAATPYDAVIEAQRADVPFRYIIVGVDHFGRDEFRLLPLVRREWPESTLVAYHSPGFDYKGRLAELVGADLVVAGLDGISALLESMDLQLRPPVRPPAPPKREPEPAPPPEPEAPPPEATVETTPSETEPAEAEPAPLEAEPPEGSRPDLPPRIELTDEELRLLLAEDDEA